MYLHNPYCYFTIVADKIHLFLAASGSPFPSRCDNSTIRIIWLLACPVPVGPFSFVVVAIIWERPAPWFVQAYKGSILFRPSQICKYLQVLHIIDSGQIGVMTSAVFLRIRPSSCLVNEVVLSDVQGECGAAQSCWQYSVGLARRKLVEYWQWYYISHLRVPAQ